MFLVRCCVGAETGREEVETSDEAERGESNKRQRLREESVQSRSEAAATAAPVISLIPRGLCFVWLVLWNDTGYERQDGESRHTDRVRISFSPLLLALSHSLCVSQSLFIMRPHSLCRLGDKSLCQITLG